MHALDELADGVKQVSELLGEDILEPDLRRTDWPDVKERVSLVYDRLDKAVLTKLDSALSEVDDDEMRNRVGDRVAGLAAEVATLLHAIGDSFGAVKLLGRAGMLSSDPQQRSEMAAGEREPVMLAGIHHGRWLQRRLWHNKADPVLRRVLRGTKDPVLKEAARRALNAPRPLTSAPPLFRLNGCGVGLYGGRDRDEDGFEVSTYCFCLFWIPVFPIAAYRVRSTGDNSYQFIARESLGPIARTWRALMLAAVVGTVAVSAVMSYLDSPSRKARIALEQAQAAEATQGREAALEQYRAVIRDHEFALDDLTPAGEAVVRLTWASMTEPCTADSVEKVGRVVASFDDLPVRARSGSPTKHLVEHLGACAEQIGDATVGAAQAGLSVLDMAAKIAAEEGSLGASIDDRRAKIRKSLAGKLATDRPLLALRHYTLIPNDTDAVAQALQIIDTFGDPPSLWVEAEPSVRAWIQSAGASADAGRVRGKLEAAVATNAEDLKLVEAAEEKPLQEAWQHMKGDQALAVALAELKRNRGDVDGALAMLHSLGPPGRLTGKAQQLLGACYAEQDQLVKADDVLTGFLQERMPAFQQAQREYSNATDALRQKLVSELKAGTIPPALERQLTAANEKDRMGIISEWISDKIDTDPTLGTLRSEYLRHASVVPASLTAAGVKLRRANAASGEERRRLLGEAERALLSIRQEAEGNPTFHIELGQVYHRLGRAEEADAEFQGVLDRKQPELTLAVASVYRLLGLVERAKQIVRGIYETDVPAEMKQQAAFLMVHLGSTTEEQAEWLPRCDQTKVEVQQFAIEVEARRLLRAGKLAEADRTYAKVAEAREREAKHNPTSANNAAVAYLERYSASGDLSHLRASVRHLESAVRLVPDNALVLGNLGDALEYLGSTTVLDRWIQTRTLLLATESSTELLDTMLSGPMRDEVLDALQKDTSLRKGIDLAQQELILAPRKVEAYRRPIRWFEWTRDTKGLETFAKRLQAVPPFDGEEAAAQRRKFEAGEKDDEAKARTKDAVDRANDRLERAQKSGHKPTIAAAWLLYGEALAGDAFFSQAPEERIGAILEAYRKAAELWPEGGMDRALPHALVIAAYYRAAAKSAVLKELPNTEKRRFPYVTVLYRAATGPSGPATLSALRAQPELAEAVRLRSAHMGTRPELSDWMLARIAGDSAMEQAAAAVFSRPEVGTLAAVEVKLFPGQEREGFELELFRGAGKVAPMPAP